MVLTVQTSEITARTSQRETRGARMEMVERLLLNGIDGQRTRLAIDLAQEYTILIPTAPTASRPSIRYLAVVRTEQTLHPSILHLSIISAFLHHGVSKFFTLHSSFFTLHSSFFT